MSFKRIRTFAIIILALVVVYLALPSYLKKGIRYLTANIDDYKIFENRLVKAGECEPLKFSKRYNSYTLTPAEEDSLKKYKTTAFLVIQNDRLLWENYYRNTDTATISNSFSMAKTIVSLLTGIAIEDGYIESLYEPAGKYLPGFAIAQDTSLKIVHLLNMSSGLNWDEAYASPFSKTTIAYYGDDLEALMSKLKVIETPGKVFKYYSANTELMGFILTQATGKSLSEYASRKLWKNIGSCNDALWSLDHKNGMEKCYCCFNATARDFARLGILLLNHGKWNDRTLVPEKYINKMIQPATELKTPNGKKVDFYGLSIWLTSFHQTPVFYFRGILGQYIIVIPEWNAVVVRLGEKRSKKYIRHAPADLFFYLSLAEKIMK